MQDQPPVNPLIPPSNEERFRLLIDAVRDYAIFMLDTEGKITTWNEGARRLKGYETHEVIGKHFSIFYSPEDRYGEKPRIELETARTVGRYEEEGLRMRKNGTLFWASVILTRIDDAAGNIVGYTKITRDLSERRAFEEELRKAKDDLEIRVKERTLELEKALQARDEFVSVASHELKTPLSALRLQAQIMQRGIQRGDSSFFGADRLLRFAKQLDTQVDRLSHLVDDMLDISRIQLGKLSMHFEKTDLSGLIHDLAEGFSAGESPLTLDVQDDVTGVWDHNRVEQVVLNLLSNAFKYGGGNPVHLEMKSTPDKVTIIVTDQGIGISKEHQERIFERFERAISASEVSGLGLGLYIVREIVKAHHGSISVESDLHKGSRFIVELPHHLQAKAPTGRPKPYDF